MTKQIIYDSAVAVFDREYACESNPLCEFDSIAAAFGLPMVCYEGGSSLYNYDEHHWDDTLSALEADPLMYDLYRRSVGYWRDTMNCVLNMMYAAIHGNDFSVLSHLTSYDQLYLPREQMMRQAPKYLAVKEACAPKRTCTVQSTRPQTTSVASVPGGMCRLTGAILATSLPTDGRLTVGLCSVAGRRIGIIHRAKVKAGRTNTVRIPVESLAAGVYLIDIVHPSLRTTMRLAITP